jgi:transcription elongation GreA/GreB family factor
MKQIVDAISESRPDVAPSPTDLEIVQLGSIVTVRKFANEDDETGTLYTFQLVGHGESAPNGSKAGSFSELPLISYTCPQGAAVIKKRVGDGITVNDSDQEMIALATQLQAANAA